MTIFPKRILLLLACLLAAAGAWAQDPPARVGRLAHIENDVQFAVDRNQRGEPASINWPISSGAVLETGQRGRAEAWIGSTAYRLNERSRVEFATIDDRRVDLRVDGGSLAVSVLDRDQAGDIAIATPDGVVRFATTGRYRIDVYADSTELSVLAGQASLDDHGRIQQVGPGQEAVLYSDGRHSLGSNRDQDPFDLWVAERENATLAGPARRHVSPRMTGYSDLDAYGEWSSAPDYGTVWYPRGVADDWAPYRYGRWAWVDPWGWTWVDDSPWGFAPFHYGRWALVYGRWCWVPGAYVATPVYAPALVAWVGSGGWSLSFGFGSGPAIGWFPLGPREVFVPSYRYSATYIRQINVTHVRDVSYIDRAVREGDKRQFAYRTQPQAVTVVPAQKLREGRPITRSDVRLAKPAELERAPRLQQAPNHAAFASPGERQRERGERAGAPRSSLFGGDAQRPGGERSRGDFRQSQPERREAISGEGRRGPERRQADEPERGRGGDARQAQPERKDAAPAERGQRNFERRAPDEDKAKPEGGRGGDFRQSQPERKEAAPAERGQRSFERRAPDEDKARPEGGRGGDFRQSQPERKEAAPAERSPRGSERRPSDDGGAAPERGRDFRQSLPERREAPAAEERRNSERPQPEAAPRREEQREIFRSERPQQRETPREAPREIEAPRQREMPRAAPEMPRAEPPRPAPQPIMREAPRSEPPRSEPPRMQAPQQPQGGGGGGRERREERREERGR